MLSLDKLLTGSVSPASIKSSQSSGIESCKTLEAYHQAELEKIRNKSSQVNEFRVLLSTLQGTHSQIEPFSLNLANLKQYENQEKEIEQLITTISRIESGEEEADYFLRVGDILFSYADAQERIANGEVTKEPLRKSRIPANSVFAYFEKETHVSTIQKVMSTAQLRAGDVITDIGFHRDKALEQYLSALHPENIQHESILAATIEERYGDCPVCDTEMVFYQNEAILSCPSCGHQDFILVDSEKPSYKDPPRESFE
jgi:rubrerythrin